MTDREINDKLDAIVATIAALKAGQSAHLEQDHGDIDKQFLIIQKRLSRIEGRLAIHDHGLAVQSFKSGTSKDSSEFMVDIVKKNREIIAS